MTDDFRTAPDGPLDGRIAQGGQRWRTYGAAPVGIYGHAVGPPPGFVPGATTGPTPTNANAAIASYASVDMGATVHRVAAEYHWDRSTSVNTGLALGAFDWGPDDIAANHAIPATAGSASMHLAITPTLVQFAVFTDKGVVDFTVLTPIGATSNTYYLRTPQLRDGRTSYTANIQISGTVATVAITGLPVLRYQDPRIASVQAHWPFFEHYSTPGGTDLPRFTRVAAVL